MDTKAEHQEKLAAETPAEHAARIIKADAEHRSLAADQTLMIGMLRPHMASILDQLAEGVNAWMHHQGFGTNDKGTEIALMHTELSELLEGIRAGDRANEAEECADLFIRLLHYCGKYGIGLGEATYQKMLRNYGRPYKHGKEF